MNGKVKSTWVVLSLFLMLCMVYPAAAKGSLDASGAGNAIGFEDEAPLEALWADPLEFVVLNNTTLDLQVMMEVGGFVHELADNPGAAALDLAMTPEGVFRLPATARKAVSVPLNPQAQPAPGIYNGWITLSTGQPATVIRRSVRLSVPAPSGDGLVHMATPRGSIVPAVSAWTLQAYRLLPWMPPVCFNGLSLGCTIPVQVNNPPPALSAGRVGTLNGDRGGGIKVAVRSSRAAYAVLGLDFTQAWAPAGAYSASLDFLPGESAGDVALTVNVKDTFVTPLLVVGLGILIAQWAQFYLTVRRGVMQVERRLAQVSVDFEAVPNEVINGYTIKNDVAVQRDAVAQALTDWRNRGSVRPTEEDQARFKAAVSEPLEKLESTVKMWVGFDAHLQKLRKALDEAAWPAIDKTRAPAHLNLDAPRFYIVARALLHGRPISLRDFTARQQVIDEAIEFANLWGELEDMRSAVAEALDFVSQYRFQLSDKGHQDLELARRKLSEAHRELWEAENLTRLRVLRTTDDLEEAKQLLNQLMGLIEVGPSGEESLQPEGIEMVGPWNTDGGTFLGRFDMNVLRNLRARLWSIVPPSLKPAQTVEEAARRQVLWLDRALMAGDLTLVVLAYAVAVIAGLKPYFTTNFGSLYDYLSAFTWGFGAKAAVEFVNAALEKFFGKE